MSDVDADARDVAMMQRALALAAEAAAAGEVPVGAVVVDDTGRVIGEGRNTREGDRDPLGHAEILAIAAASRVFLGAIHDGSPAAFLSATAAISPRLLGSVRETARQAIAEAVDAFDPDAIFVLHAGILADLAIETGVPVAIHVAGGDLDIAGRSDRVRDLVAAALGSAEAVAAEDDATATAIARDWLDQDDAASRPQVAVFAAGPDRAAGILAACEQAIARRRG